MGEMMKAAFLNASRPTAGSMEEVKKPYITIEEVQKPECGPNDVLVKVNDCAICGSDLRMLQGTKNVSATKNAQYKGYGEGKFILGHEIVGVVEEIGSKVANPEYKVGDKVIIVTSTGCQEKSCRQCGDGLYNRCINNEPIGYEYPGGLAEYILVQELAVKHKNIVPVSADYKVSDEHLAMVEPLSCVIYGQNYLNIKNKDLVTVIGAGPIGLMHALLAKNQGAEVILVQRSKKRLDMAKKNFNFDHYIHNTEQTDLSKEIMELTIGRGTDVGIIACSETSAIGKLYDSMAKGGRLSIFAGLPKGNSITHLDANVVHYREVSIFGAFASNRAEFEQALEAIGTGAVSMDKIVTHTFPLENIESAIELMLNKESGALKVVIKP